MGGLDLRRVSFQATSIVLLGGLALGADAARRASLLLVNESPSLPRGLYARSLDGLARPAVVAFVQPPEARRYLGSLGMPGTMPLLKRVAAVEGDWVCAGAEAIATPSGRAAVLGRDRRGAPLPRWRGCRRLRGGEVFVLGDSAASFDSRYFGPIQTSSITGVYEEVLTW